MGDWDIVGERATPKSGAGAWDVVGEEPFLPVQEKRKVGAGEAFLDDLKAGSSRLGRDVIAAAGSPLLAVDAIANKLTGKETGAAEWWANNVFGPYQNYVDQATAKRAETERSVPAELAGAAGNLVNTVPAMVAGNKIQQAMKIAEGVPALGQLLTRAFAGAQPLAVPAAVDRYADVRAMGDDALTATNAAVASYANMAGQGMAPMGMAGSLGKRIVTGAVANPVLGAAGRTLENVVNATSADPRLQQQVVSPEQAVIDAVMGAGMHGVMGERASRVQTPEAVAADRTNWNNAHDAETVLANHTVTPEPMSISDLIASVTGAQNRPESMAEFQTQQKQDKAARRERGRELSATFRDVELPNDPAVPVTKEQAVRQAYTEQGIDPDSTLTAIKRGYAADGMELPPTVREGVQKENRDAVARQAFDLAARRQRQADADLANRDEIAPDYQGGGSAAHGGEFDSGIRRVTLLDGELPVEVISHDGKKARVVIEQNGKTFEFEVDPKRITEHDIPQNQRMAQDFRARSDEPPKGVGVGTMQGEKMPRRSTDRIAGDEIGGRTTPYNTDPKDGGKVEGTVLPPDAGTSVSAREQMSGETINGTATAAHRPAPADTPLIGERRLLENRNRFAVDEQGRAVDRENRVSGGEGKPLNDAPMQQERATPHEQQTPKADAREQQENASKGNSARSEQPHPTGSRLVRDPFGAYHEVTMSDGSLVKIAKSDPASDGGIGAWHIDLDDTHYTTNVPSPSQVGHISTVLGFNKAEAIAAIPEKLAQMERYRRAQSEQPGPTVEQRAKDPETLDMLKRMAKNAGWQEEGGKLLRDENHNVIGRTKWVAKEPWFGAGMGEANVHEAVARVEEGKPLTKKHRNIVETMLDYIEENDILGRKAQAEENLAGAGLDPTPENMSDYDVAERALLLYPDQFKAITVRNADKPESQFFTELRSLLDEQGNDKHTAETGSAVPERAHEPDSQRGAEGSGATDRTHEANDGAREGSADAGTERQGFSLDSYSAEELRAAAERKAAEEQQQSKQDKAADDKAKADAEVGDFALTGSDRKADANPKQSDLLDGPNKLYDIGGYVGENLVKTMKSVLGWTEQKIGGVLHKVTDPVFSTVDGAPSAGLLDFLNRKFADNFAFVEKVQKSVGHEVEEAADTVMAHRLLSGKTGDRLRRFDDELLTPLKDAIKTASKNKGVTLDDINDFLYARHAGERNSQIARINPGKTDGSGITNERAREILAGFEKDGKAAALKRIAAEFDKITAFERQTLADSGLISKDTLQKWKQAYQFYAPLKGEESERAFSPTGGSSGFGSSTKYGRATGRFSQATNLIERALMNAQIAVIRSEKAEVGRAFLKFMQDNPNKALVSGIDKLPIKAVVRKDGTVGYEKDGLAAMRDNVMHVVDRAGETHSITFANNEAGALLARALNGMGAQESGVVLRVMSKISRTYAALQTKWNPEFVITNAMRDVQTALGTVGAEFGQKMNGKVLSDYGKAAKAIMANESGGKIDFSTKEWKDWHDRFRAAGGETHFVSVDDVATNTKALQQSVESGFSALTPAGAKRKFLDVTGKALGVIDVANSAVENALRLSVFKNLVEAGHSESKAALAAKEVTVNFNRHGEWGPAINSAYVFFNAAAQGQLRLVRLFKNHPKEAVKFAASLAGIGASLAASNYMLSGTDDDGRSYYDKVPTEVKNRWAVMMLPDSWADNMRQVVPGWMMPSAEETKGQLYLKLFPLAPGMNMFFNTGSGIVEASNSGDAGLAREIMTKRVLSTVVDSFNPFGQNSMVSKMADGEYSDAAGELLKLIAPTAFDPAIELSQNSNFMGEPIYKKQEERSTSPARPNSEVAFKKTSDTSKAIARWLNSATGGDDLRSGGIDMSADKLDYIAGYITGGAGRFWMNLGKTVGDAAEGKTPDYRRVPFSRLGVGDARGAPYDHFNDAQHEVQLAAKEKAAGRETNLDVAALRSEEKATAAFIKEQRGLLAKVQANENLTDDEIHERESAINKRIESRMKMFMGKYYDAGGKKRSY